jgi:hypothetical protein
MKRLLLAATAACLLALPAQASARIDPLDPSVLPGSAISAGDAILAVPDQLTSATLTEYAFGGTGAPSPLGLGNKTLEPDPKQLVGFPTFGDTYGILSSGDTNTIASTLSNTSGSTGFAFDDQFKPLLDPPNRDEEANDWTVLRLNVEVPGGANCLSLDYRFLSEEFPEFVNKGFNDAFIAEIDSTSWSVPTGDEVVRPNDFAASPAGEPISVNGVGPTAVTVDEAAGTYFDAATGLITTKTPITPGSHAIYLSIFDAGDQIYDSAVFLDDLRFITESGDTCKPPTGKELAPPPPPPPGQPAPPNNKFKPGSSVSFGKSSTSATLTIEVPGPGLVTAGSTTVGAAAAIARRIEAAAAKQPAKGKGKAKGKKKAKKKVKKPLLKTSSVRANQAGPVQITVSLSATGKAVLAKKGKLTIPVTLTFTPDGGTSSSQVQSVTFKSKAKTCGAKGKAKGKAKKSAKGGKQCKQPKGKGKGKGKGKKK